MFELDSSNNIGRMSLFDHTGANIGELKGTWTIT